MRNMVILAAVAFMATAADAHEPNDRKGYAFSVSLGVAPVTQFRSENVNDAGTAMVFGLSGGFGWSGRDLLALQWYVSTRKSEHFTRYCQEEHCTHLDGSPVGNLKMWQFFYGLGWSHYLREDTRSLYTNIAVGMDIFSVNDLGKNDPGFSYMLGCGYQFSENLQAGAFALFGDTDDYFVDYDHTQIGLLVSLVWN